MSGRMHACVCGQISNAFILLCRHLPKLPRLLESEDVNMRIAAGETIALLFELARDLDSVSSVQCSQLLGLNCCCWMEKLL